MENTVRILSIFLIFIFFPASSFAGDDEGKTVEISYVEMKPSFVSNLFGGPKYIRCNIQLMTKYAENVPEIETHMPALRHSVLMLLASSDGARLATPEGKEEFRLAALESIRSTLEELTEEPRVKDLYLTAYYVK